MSDPIDAADAADQPENYTDEPIYWFAALDKVVELGDHLTAAKAQNELGRLGVSVRYGRCRRPQSAPASKKVGKR